MIQAKGVFLKGDKAKNNSILFTNGVGFVNLFDVVQFFNF